MLRENPYTANAYIVSLKCFHVFIWPDNSDDLRQYLFVEVKITCLGFATALIDLLYHLKVLCKLITDKFAWHHSVVNLKGLRNIGDGCLGSLPQKI